MDWHDILHSSDDLTAVHDAELRIEAKIRELLR